jgi:hypothetical protein
VDYASIDYDGKFISMKDPDPQVRQLAYEAPPNYNAGAYSTLYFLISEIEREMYAYRKQRKIDVPLKEVMLAIVNA